MSWDILLMSDKEFPENFSDIPKTWRPEPMGSLSSARERISRIAPGTDWSDPSRGRFRSDRFGSLDFGIGKEEIVEAIMVHVRGSGEPLTLLAQLCQEYGWVAMDCSDSTLIDFNQTSADGLEKWQKYRDQSLSG